MASTNPPERGKTSLGLLFPSALSKGYIPIVPRFPSSLILETHEYRFSARTDEHSSNHPPRIFPSVRRQLLLEQDGQIPPSLIRDQVSRLKLRTRVGSAGRVNRKKKEKEKEASLARSNPSLQRVLAMEVAREERDRERRKKKKGVAQVCTCMSRLDNIGDLEGTDNKVMHAVLQDAPYYPA